MNTDGFTRHFGHENDEDAEKSNTLCSRQRIELRCPMKIQDTGSGKREELGFTEAVAQYIAPMLIARGFTCTEKSIYSVRFQSANVALVVYHDRLSYEIELYCARLTFPSERYSLADLVEASLTPDSENQVFFQASQKEGVTVCIKAIADILLRHGESFLAGDATAYQQIGDTTRRNAAAYEKQSAQRPIHSAAEIAWRQHDYAKVRYLYEPIEGDLTLVERKKLDYARSHSRSP